MEDYRALLHYLRFLAARRCSLFIVAAAGAAAGAAGGNTGGHCSRWGALQGVALWPIDTHRARHKQSRSGTGRPPPRISLCPGLEAGGHRKEMMSF